jgi:hypothetical protein
LAKKNENNFSAENWTCSREMVQLVWKLVKVYYLRVPSTISRKQIFYFCLFSIFTAAEMQFFAFFCEKGGGGVKCHFGIWSWYSHNHNISIYLYFPCIKCPKFSKSDQRFPRYHP